MKDKVFSGNNQIVIYVYTMNSQQIWFKSIPFKQKNFYKKSGLLQPFIQTFYLPIIDQSY